MGTAKRIGAGTAKRIRAGTAKRIATWAIDFLVRLVTQTWFAASLLRRHVDAT